MVYRTGIFLGRIGCCCIMAAQKLWFVMPRILEVNVHSELKRARDAFYHAMFEGDEEAMRAANNAVGYYESFDGDYCPEYPGF